MDKIVVWYLRMSVIYFVAGAALGMLMLVSPGETGVYRDIHVHFNLLGFMSMMIYGVGYHILPKFSGVNIYSVKIMNLQFWLSNIGLIGMAVSWPMTIVNYAAGIAGPLLILSAALSLTAAILFAFNILKTIRPVKM
ncbi:MAG: cbb3-type cytochrome c oxidase subunit I [Nitrospirae bacterium]|nr:cbb3-type cytochrome c oxidase subunit I [Nitrospirota bacterium]